MITTNKQKETAWERAIKRIAKKDKCTVEFMTVALTQDDAKKLLQGNETNRHQNKELIKRYLRIMEKDRWVLNGETIKIGRDKDSFVLLDGQHRLNAIAKASKPVTVSLAIGLEKDHFKSIDTGKSRSASDIIKMAGYKNVHILSAATRWMLTYELDERFMWSSVLCPEDILEGVSRWPKMTHFATVAERLRFLLQPSIVAFFMYVTQHIDPDMSHDFFTQMEYGDDLDKKSPIYEFRTIMMKFRSQQVLLDKRHAMAYIIKTWNAYYNDINVTTIRWKQGQAFPEIEGVNRDTLFNRNSL